MLAVCDGHLVHDYNAAGVHTVLRSAQPVPAGATRLTYAFQRTGRLCGDAVLAVDGEPVAETSLEGTLGVHMNAVGVSVGLDPYGPVSDGYTTPFAYGPRLARVVVEVGDDAGSRGLGLDRRLTTGCFRSPTGPAWPFGRPDRRTGGPCARC